MMFPSQSSSATERCIDWSISFRPFDGGLECGDACTVVVLPNGALVAAIDGLGHGAEAAAAAQVAIDCLAGAAVEPILQLMERCHEALRKTRGAAITMAVFDAGNNTMTWTGVGNVEAMLFRVDQTAVPRRESLSLRGGVVGYQIPPLRANTLPVFAGDTLVMATDGIDSGFSMVSVAGRTPRDISADILEAHAKGTDDALVFAGSYTGFSA